MLAQRVLTIFQPRKAQIGRDPGDCVCVGHEMRTPIHRAIWETGDGEVFEADS